MMKFSIFKTTAFTVLASALLIWAIPQLQAQEGMDFSPFGEETPSALEPAEQDAFGEQTPTAPQSEAAQDFIKEMVTLPPQAEKPTLDADDFRDPFFFLKRDGDDSKQVLTPGTTVDGMRFNTYNDSKNFVDRYYKNSNFVLKDVFGRIELVNKEGGCLKCHRGIEEISQNHRFSCIKCHRGSLKGKTVAQGKSVV